MSMMPGGGAPIVHLLCGLNGAGKTTYARRLAEARGAVRFSLDEWLLTLHPGIRYDAPEYGPLAERGKLLIWDVAGQVLALGHDVVLDWNSWSRAPAAPPGATGRGRRATRLCCTTFWSR